MERPRGMRVTLFELSPFARHTDHYRDAQTGKLLWESPHLETRDEFEQRTRDNLHGPAAGTLPKGSAAPFETAVADAMASGR